MYEHQIIHLPLLLSSLSLLFCFQKKNKKKRITEDLFPDVILSKPDYDDLIGAITDACSGLKKQKTKKKSLPQQTENF